jgi:hypothetical protein
VDEEIDELKELVRHNTKVAEETNRIVHGMQRSARWGVFFRIFWWLTIFGISSALYFYYVQPYVAEIERLYGGAKGWSEQISNFFEQYSPGGQ